jgi:hypothetical protein
MGTTNVVPDLIQKILLACGILAPLLYFGADRLAGGLVKDYDFTVHSMSDLPAAGSPVRRLALVLAFVSAAVLSAFAAGVWRAAGTAVLPRIVAGLIAGNALAGLFSSLFFPNTYRVHPAFGTPGVLTMFVSVLCFVLAMIFGALAYGGWLRVLSIAIPAGYMLLTVLRYATATAANAGAMSGSQERTMVYTYLVWLVALAAHLLRAPLP